MFEQRSENSSVEDISDDYLNLVDELNLSLRQYNLPQKVHHVYEPTIYARNTFEMYVRKYCNTPKPIMYLGINPGPYGQVQTGVPLGDVKSVKNWLRISGVVGKPEKEFAKCRVRGFNCTKSEVSGSKFWNLFKSLCGTPEIFFESSFVHNYFPQQWMAEKGGNITPADCKVGEIKELCRICDRVFIKVLELYKVEKIVALGKFCETRAKKAIKEYLPSKTVEVLYLRHPSPLANRGKDWEPDAREFLEKSNLLQYYVQTS